MTPFTFTDHDGFHRTALRLVAGAALGGALTFAFASVTGLGNALLWGPVVAAGFAGAAAGHVVRGVKGALLGAAWLAASIASSLLFPDHPTFGLLWAGAFAGYGLYRLRLAAHPVDTAGPRPGRLTAAAAVAVTAVAVLVASRALDAIIARGIVEQLLPELLAAATYGAAFGLFLALGAAGSHVMPDPDPVELAYARACTELSGDFRAIAARAIDAYRQAQAALGAAEGPARREIGKGLVEVTTRIVDLSRRWQQVEREMGGAAEGELGKKLVELQKLGEATQDGAAKRQYAIAEKTLQDELAQVQRIRTGRERVVARLHGQMALLERTRFALVGLRSSDAHRAAAEMETLSNGLSAVAKELDAESEAVDEIVAAA